MTNTPRSIAEALPDSVWIVFRENGEVCCYAYSEDNAAGAAVRPGYTFVRYDRRALATANGAEGFVLVPVKATPEMRDAIRFSPAMMDAACDARYAALLAAAPSAEMCSRGEDGRDAARYRRLRDCFHTDGSVFTTGPNDDRPKFYPRLWFSEEKMAAHGWPRLTSPVAVRPGEADTLRRGADAAPFVDAWVDAAIAGEGGDHA